MTKHPTDFIVKLDWNTVSTRLSKMRYDMLALILANLADRLAEDAATDKSRDRIKLHNALKKAAHSLNQASLEVNEAWKICAPYEDADDS